jgi:hypothetical protein
VHWKNVTRQRASGVDFLQFVKMYLHLAPYIFAWFSSAELGKIFSLFSSNIFVDICGNLSILQNKYMFNIQLYKKLDPQCFLFSSMALHLSDVELDTCNF